MVFEKVPEQRGYTLESQWKKLENFGVEQIEDCVEDVYSTPDQFLVLTSPKVQNKVRYVQTCYNNGEDEIEVELAIDEEDGIHLVYKMCSIQECINIFVDFFENKFQPKLEEYQPVQF